MNAPTPASNSLTASIDLGFLNTIVAEAVSTAALRVHLESSDDPSDQRTVASWSAPVANLVGGQIQLKTQISPGSKLGLNWGIKLDSDPAFPVISIANVNGAPVLTATLDFITPAALTGVDDITLNKFEIVVTVNFDGTFTVVANVQANPLVFGAYDPTGDVITDVETQVNATLTKRGITPDKIKSAIESFFVSLLRLSGWVQVGVGPTASWVPGHGVIDQYAIEGDSLIVTYHLAASPVVVQLDPSALQNVLSSHVHQVSSPAVNPN